MRVSCSLGGERADRVEVPPGEAAALVLPRDLLHGGIEVEEGEELWKFRPSTSRSPGRRSRCV